MIKKIIIENVITEEDDKRILYYLNRFLSENFQKYKDIKITILTDEKKD
jgi:hypothetical protein